MPCVLRISGVLLDADALANAVTPTVYRVDRKGEARLPSSRGVFDRSAIHIDVSEAEAADLATQVADAIAFLDAHAGSIEAALHFPGVEQARLDFAVESSDAAIDSKYLPPELLRRAGELGLGIELSFYPPGTE
jgi:hypothetical protein